MSDSHRNSRWSYDELILALDIYFRFPKARGNKNHPEVLRLSQQLNRMASLLGNQLGPKYRNANGISMTLNAFLRFDPEYSGRGLQGGAQMEDVWNAFSSDRNRLADVAYAIRHALSTRSPPHISIPLDDDIDGAVEGRLLSRLHLIRERDQKLVAKKKLQTLRKSGVLACEVCDFDFEAAYGARGVGFAECHHEKPLSSIRFGEHTRLSDLRILCANCHRMIHRTRPWLSFDELRRIARTTNPGSSAAGVEFSLQQP